MVQLAAGLAADSFLQLEGEDLDGILAEQAGVPLFLLAHLAAVEVSAEDVVLPLHLVGLLAVVDVVEVLEAEQVDLEAVVELVLEQGFHQVQIADGVVNQVHLFLDDQELVDLLALLHDPAIVLNL